MSLPAANLNANPRPMTTPSMNLGPVTVYFGHKNGKYPDGNQVVVTGGDTKVAFDMPLVAKALGAEFRGTELVILGHVHEDHCAGLHCLPDATVYAPQADLGAVQSVEGMMQHYGYSPAASEKMRAKIAREFHYRPRPEARGYPDGQVWELGGGVTVRAIHMPGHTRGHSVLMVEPGAVAYIGDIDLSGFGPYYGDACSDLRQFRDTLERIEHMEARVWITFHHKGVITERESFLQLLHAFKDKIDRREQAILEVIGAKGKTLEQLVAHRFMYPPSYYDVYVEDAERMCILEHLSILREEGRISEEGDIYRRSEAA